VAATHSRKPGPGRPKGALNKRTLELGGPLTQQKQKVTRALLDRIASDRDLATLMWLCALKAKNDPRYIPAMLAVADRKWGRVKFELDHEGPEQIIVHLGSLPMKEMGYKPLGYIPTSASHLLPPVKVTYVEPPDEAKAPGNGTPAPKLPHSN